MAQQWSTAAVEAARPRFAPVSVSEETHAVRETDEIELPVRKPRQSRVAVTDETLVVTDFKTDAPPAGPVEATSPA